MNFYSKNARKKSSRKVSCQAPRNCLVTIQCRCPPVPFAGPAHSARRSSAWLRDGRGAGSEGRPRTLEAGDLRSLPLNQFSSSSASTSCWAATRFSTSSVVFATSASKGSGGARHGPVFRSRKFKLDKRSEKKSGEKTGGRCGPPKSKISQKSPTPGTS